MRYSHEAPEEQPQHERPGNADSGMATEYSASGMREGGQGLEAPAAQPRHIGGCCPRLRSCRAQPHHWDPSQNRKDTVRMCVGLFRRSRQRTTNVVDHTDFSVLSHPCVPGVNPVSSWCITL